MTAPADIPLSTIPWLIGSAGVLTVGFKSFWRYRQTHVELSKYIAWFALLVGTAQALFSIPTLFTLNAAVLRPYILAGEGFFYASMVAQAVMVWFLLLRTRLSAYYLAVPTGLIGAASWLYAILRADVFVKNDFLYYIDPRFSTLIIAALMIGLFTPVGIYFLRLAPRQKGLKSTVNALAFGLVYLGTGFISGGFEIATGQLITHASIPGLTVFFIILLLAALWPRRPDAKPSVQLATEQSQPDAPGPSAAPPANNTPAA